MTTHRSRKRASAREYRKSREQRFVRARGRCEIQAPGCTQTATEAHHVIKRSHLLINTVENLRACCHNCNQWVELNPNKAEEMGFVKTAWPQL